MLDENLNVFNESKWSRNSGETNSEALSVFFFFQSVLLSQLLHSNYKLQICIIF